MKRLFVFLCVICLVVPLVFLGVSATSSTSYRLNFDPDNVDVASDGSCFIDLFVPSGAFYVEFYAARDRDGFAKGDLVFRSIEPLSFDWEYFSTSSGTAFWQIPETQIYASEDTLDAWRSFLGRNVSFALFSAFLFDESCEFGDFDVSLGTHAVPNCNQISRTTVDVVLVPVSDSGFSFISGDLLGGLFGGVLFVLPLLVVVIVSFVGVRKLIAFIRDTINQA